MSSSVNLQIAALREQIARLESAGRRHLGVLPFGLESVDRKIPGGGLALGALHEVAGGGNGAVHGAAAALFAAGIAARTSGQVLWCVTRRDLFAPALAQAGLHPDRVIYAEVGDEKAVLACMEEGLRHGGLAAVVGELARLPMVASRRLQLCAEETGTIALAIRRWRRMTEAADFGHPVAFLRDELERDRFVTCAAANGLRDGRSVRTAGLVLVRQRPGSAKNVTFITIEDETGISNLVVWPDLYEKQRRIVLTASMLAIQGRVQREGDVIHLICARLFDLTPLLSSLGEREFPKPGGRGDGARFGVTDDPQERRSVMIGGRQAG